MFAAFSSLVQGAARCYMCGRLSLAESDIVSGDIGQAAAFSSIRLEVLMNRRKWVDFLDAVWFWLFALVIGSSCAFGVVWFAFERQPIMAAVFTMLTVAWVALSGWLWKDDGAQKRHRRQMARYR